MGPPKGCCYAFSRASEGQDSSGRERVDPKSRAAALRAPPTRSYPVAVTGTLLPIPLAKWVPHYSSHECEWFT
jgi:hypothetical protein